MTSAQARRLRQHGLSITPGALQGFAVLLLGLASSPMAALSGAPASASTAAGAAPLTAPHHLADKHRARQPLRFKRQPSRSFRS